MSRRPVLFGLGTLGPLLAPTAPPELGVEEGVDRPPFGVPRAYVHSGQLMVAEKPTLVITILGSCVAVCVWDPEAGVGGLNHFLLPWESEAPHAALRHGTTAVEGLIAEAERRGARRGALRAKVFGGASVLQAMAAANPLGSRNVETARAALEGLGIAVVAEDIGGTRGRKLFFHTADGRAWVRKL